MRKSLIVLDDFLDNPNEQRKIALSKEFRDFEFAGEVHHGSAIDDGDFPWEKMQEAIGEEIRPILSFYRMHHSGTEFDPGHWIHSDRITSDAKWAIVVYLTDYEPDAMNGTATFKHIGLGVRSCPSIDSLRAAGLSHVDVYNMLERDGADARNWKMSEFVQLVPNRAVIYPCANFHGRFPFHAFGDGPDTSRLIWVGFTR